MTIAVIQMGHFPRKSGVTGAPGEQAYAQGVALRAEPLLQNLGLRVRIIYADPSSVSQYKGDLFFAVHYDSSSSKSPRGGSVGYQTAQGKRIASLWKMTYQRRGFDGGFRADNYTKALAEYYGVRQAVRQGTLAATILEGGFGSHPVEGPWLRSALGMTTNAHAIVDASALYLGIKKADPVTPPINKEDDVYVVRYGDGLKAKDGDLRVMRAQRVVQAAGQIKLNVNLLPKWGLDGKYGNEFRDAVNTMCVRAQLPQDGATGMDVLLLDYCRNLLTKRVDGV